MRSGGPSVRAHDLMSNPIGFVLFGIVGLADGQLGLDQTAAQKFLYCLVPSLLLQLKHGMQRRAGGHGPCRGTGWAGASMSSVLRAFDRVFHALLFLFTVLLQPSNNFVHDASSFACNPSPERPAFNTSLARTSDALARQIVMLSEVGARSHLAHLLQLARSSENKVFHAYGTARFRSQ